LGRSFRAHYYLFDPSGRELTDQSPPPEIRALAGTSFQSGRMETNRHINKSAAALTLKDASGNTYVIVRQSLQGLLKEAFSQDIGSFLGKAALMLGITCALSLLAARYVTNPIRKLREAMNRFARGDFSSRSKDRLGNRSDEIGALAEDFDRMADRIQTLMRTQTRFLRDISHELRSPLTRMGIALDLIQDDPSEDPSVYLDQIRKESERMQALTKRLLALVRMEEETGPAKGSIVDLTALLQQICDTGVMEARLKQCDIKCALEHGVRVNGHKELLFSAVENVVRNAIHHAPPQTDVSVSLERTEEGGRPWAVIRVRDHGVGVPEEFLDDILKPFFRVDESRDRRSGGTGLGLAIAHSSVRRHLGTIACTNAPGGGLQVRIALPAC